MPITSELKDKLTQKIGPLPAWGWAAAIIGGYAVFKLFHKSSSTDTTAPGIYDLGAGGSGGTPPPGGSGGFDPGSGGGGGGGGGGGQPVPTGGGGGSPAPVPVPGYNPSPAPSYAGFDWQSFLAQFGSGFGGFTFPTPGVQVPQPAITPPTIPTGFTGVNYDPTLGAYQYIVPEGGGIGGLSFNPAPITNLQTALDLGSADAGNPADVAFIANNYYHGDLQAARAGITNAVASQSGDWSNPMVQRNQSVVNPVGTYINDTTLGTNPTPNANQSGVQAANAALGTTTVAAPYYTTDPTTGVQTYHAG